MPSAKMKLLYIHQYFKFPHQADGTRSYDLATSFVKQGIQVTVISSNPEPKRKDKRWEIYEKEGIQFYMLSCEYSNTMSFKKRIMAFLKFMFFATIKALRLKSDVILATSTPLTIAIPALLCKWFKRTPYIFEVRDVWPEVPIKMGFIKNRYAVKFLYWFELLVYKYSSWIVPLSTGMENNINCRYPNSKMTVIPNISEITRFKKTGKKINLPFDYNGKKILLYAGTLGNVNGLKYVVDLATLTQNIDSSIVYLIFGRGKEKDEILKYAEKANVLNKTFFYGGIVAKSDLPYLYSKCTIGSSFVINNPVLWDNSANKFFDTLAASKPIVINHQGWQAETITKHNIGYVLPAEITDESAGKFVEYMNNTSLIAEQEQNAFALAKSEYSLEVAASRYMEIFNKL